jgi:hypothetical protein
MTKIYTLQELRDLILPMVQAACGKNQSGALTDAIVELIKQDREARDAQAD